MLRGASNSPSLFLVVRKGDQSSRYPLVEQPLLLGRDPRSVPGLPPGEAIVIPDGSVSRWQYTVYPRGDHAEVEANPQSPNPLVKNGALQNRAKFFPGEFIQLGPYLFEFEAEVEVPIPIPDALPPDPAGVIDLRLARSDLERIAPRWRMKAQEAASDDQVTGVQGIEPASPGRRLLVPAAVLALVAVLVAGLVMDRRKQGEQTADSEVSLPDVFRELRPPDCANRQACLNLAKDFFQTGRALAEHDPGDLISRYKIARSLHQALMALKDHPEDLPELKPRYDQARQDFEQSFSDVRFRYQRAYEHEDTRGQLTAIEAQRPICKEYKHEFCETLELDYKRLRE